MSTTVYRQNKYTQQIDNKDNVSQNDIVLSQNIFILWYYHRIITDYHRDYELVDFFLIIGCWSAGFTPLQTSLKIINLSIQCFIRLF